MIKFYIKIIVYAFIIVSFFASLMIPLGGEGWYQGYSFFSDWRNKECNYATNPYCYNYYNNKEAKWYRFNKFTFNELTKFNDFFLPNTILNMITCGDTVLIGLDRYALFKISASLVPKDVLKKTAKELIAGKVIVMGICFDKENNQIRFFEK